MLQKQIDETLKYVIDLHDDRLLVLIGALFVENTIDNFLSAVIPDFKLISNNRDFTFSMRITLA